MASVFLQPVSTLKINYAKEQEDTEENCLVIHVALRIKISG